MIFLQYTTKTEKAIIREAMALKGYRDAIRHGWKRLSSGVNRTGFRKQNVVVKFTMRKLQRYQSAKHDMLFYLKTPPHQRKYLARIFAVADDRVVQRYANQSRWTSKQKALGYRILDTLRIIYDFQWIADIESRCCLLE